MENRDLPVQDAAEDRAVSGFLRNAYDWLESIVTAIVICILVFLFVGRMVNVDGNSMNPTLYNNDKVMITRIFSAPRRGDIVVFTKHSYGDDSLVKRVIATEGETVDIDFDRGVVTVDGVVLDEPYIAEATHRMGSFQYPLTVEDGCIFVMGDNRNASTDSRSASVGMVDTRCVIGKVLFRVWPLSSFGTVKTNG